MNDLDGLQFDNDLPFNDQIGTKALFEFLLLVDDGNRNLTLNNQPSVLSFARQRRFVNRLQQPRAQVLMQVNRAIHNHSSDLILMHLRVSVTL